MEFEEEGETEEQFCIILYFSSPFYSLSLPSSHLLLSPLLSPSPLPPPPSLLPYPASYHKSLFATRSPMVEGVGEGVEGYRVSQVLTILQNLSFEENTQQFLVQHTGVRR